MADKKLTLGLSIDMREFDAAIKKMQQDISKLQSPAMGSGGAPQKGGMQYPMLSGGALQTGGAGADAFRAATQANNQLGQKFRQEQQMSRAQFDALTKEKSLIADIAKNEKEITAQKQAQLKIDQQRNRISGGSAVPNRNGMMGGPIMHGPWPQQTPGAGGGGGAGANILKGIIPAVGIATFTAYAKQLAIDFAIRPVDILKTQGSAMQGTLGKTLGQAQTGQFAFEGMFPEERKKAAEAARTTQERQSFLDTLNIFSERGRAKLFDPQKYAAMQAESYGQNFQTALEGGKGMDAFKKDATERLQRDMRRDISSQRQLGLEDKGYYGKGGFLQTGSAQFGADQLTNMAGGIIGAGGSTAMGRGAVTGLQAERGLNLTNASTILGSLSGSMGSSETSKATLIDIFSTAQAMGLDKSKFAEENRRFIQTVAEVVNQGTMTSKMGAQAIAGEMGGFATGTNTIKGLENARAAYQAYQAATTSTSGYTGGQNFATMMTEAPKLARGAGGAAGIENLMSLKQNEMDPNSEYIKSKTAEYNRVNKEKLTPEQYVKELNKAQGARGMNLVPGEKGELQDIGAQIKQYNAGTHAPGENFQLKGKGAEGFGTLLDRMKMVYPGKSLPELTQIAMGTAAAGAGTTAQGPGFENIKKQAEEAMGTTKTGKGIDEIIAASAENAQISLRTLATSINDFATNAVAAAARLTGNEAAARANSAASQAGMNEHDAMADSRERNRAHDRQVMEAGGIPYARDPYKLQNTAAASRAIDATTK